MTTSKEGWTPYDECPYYTRTSIDLPEGLTIENAIERLVQEGVIDTRVTPASHTDNIRIWDVKSRGLPQRLISSQEESLQLWSPRDRFGERDIPFEDFVCGIRSKIKDARIQIYT